MIELSSFQSFDFAADPITDKWKGANKHIGPVQTVTPLVELLAGKTTFGTVSLMSGVIAWAAARLRPFTDVSYLDDLFDATFAWQHDWRYLKPKADPRGEPDQPPEVSAAMVLRGTYLLAICRPISWRSFYQPVMEASHLVNVTEFILPKDAKSAFKDWLITISDRLDEIAEVPDLEEPDIDDFDTVEDYREYCRPMRGVPLPPVVLEPSTDIAATDLTGEADAFLAGLNPAANRYLHSPEDMLASGFEGQPYRPGA